MENNTSFYGKQHVVLWKTSRRFGEKNQFTRNGVQIGVVQSSLNAEIQKNKCCHKCHT